ncbi:DUF3772 domain-containing protein [Ramlibacter sp. H39-3-26]|uniref:DUF3772 domain-containing protein n=1 Tax=Curvibacter soli TaxID=3031331 RepID=UPI0023DAEE3E|nr:DUF3772 domain-containing protein [Ramlibacter sp. H39-3-26]MDF1485906.1 DUF3772 domain-containing protein [Ramlibacter sp. H39-3-26]
MAAPSRRRPPAPLQRIGMALLLLLALSWADPLLAAPAQPAAAATSPAAEPPSVDTLRRRLEAIPTLPDDDAGSRARLDEIYAIGAAASQLAHSRAGDLADLDSRLAGLGPEPEKGGVQEAPDVARQRAALNRQRASLDAELKLARLVAVDAGQRGADLVRQRHAQFQAALTARASSPLGSRFWRDLGAAWPTDRERLGALGAELQDAMATAFAAGHRLATSACLLGALLLAALGNWAARGIVLRVALAHLPGWRLRRALMAIGIAVVHAALAGAAAQLLLGGLGVGDGLSDRLHSLGRALVRLAAFAGFAIGLGRALLSHGHGAWRLAPVSDALAARLAPYPWWIVLVSALGGLLTEVNSAAGASLALEVGAQSLTALLVAALGGGALRRMRPAGAEPARPLWLGLLLACAGAACAATVLCVLTGYVALAGTLARQMVWSGMVFATTYLLLQLVDELCAALLSSSGSFGQRLCAGLGVRAGLLDQFAVLVAGVLRVALLFYMAIALMAPFGTGPGDLLRRGGTLDPRLKVGEFTLAPQAILGAFTVAAVGFMAVRAFKHWLGTRYLPQTALEPGARSSIVTLLGFAGGVVVAAFTLSALGISVDRIAWVASALSVGIGFGLQAIVQNFIAGLILLVERPVKVGDWVVLGDVQGDVRRINVRATEVELADRSSVIVPNSDFITKTVRNFTLANAQGRVLLRLPAPLDTDAQRMRAVLLQVFGAHPDVLPRPAPAVLLEGIQGGTLTFLAIGYVADPRRADGVRSDLLFGILEALRGAGLALSPPASTTVAPPGAAALPEAADSAPAAQ